MPLILAIEPDRRQATQLAAVVKARLQADLVLESSAERALAALGDRVPDLILSSALLSPTDEVVLGERLRALDSAAAHVQTLTIPVLASPRKSVRAQAGGVLSAFRRGKSQATATEGCDPAVFASQCAEYLERAVAEHAIKAAAAEEQAESGATFQDAETVSCVVSDFGARDVEENTLVQEFACETGPEPVVTAETWKFEVGSSKSEPTSDFGLQTSDFKLQTMPEPIVAVEPMPEPVAVVEAMPEPEPIVFVEPIPEPIVPMAAIPAPRPVRSSGLPLIVDTPAATATVQEAIAKIEAFVQSQSFEMALDQDPEFEAFEASEASDSLPEDKVSDGFVELDLSQWVDDRLDPAPPTSAKVSDTEEDEPFVYEINVAGAVDDVDDLDDFSDEAAVDFPADIPDMVPDVAPIAMSPRAAAANDREVWTPARLGVSQLWPPMDGIVLQPPAAAHADNRTLIAAHTPSRRAVERQKPVQDEWGFFDPEQCGFAALLAKLDEIVDTDDATMEKSNLS